MKQELIKKGVVILIIFFFIGFSVFPSNANVFNYRSDHKVNRNTGSNYTNYLGTMFYNFSMFSSEIGFKIPENTSYTYPIVDGNFTLNFTVEVNCSYNQILLFPRGVYTYVVISINNTPIWAEYDFNFIRSDSIIEWIVKDIERNFSMPPFNDTEKVNLSIFLQGRGFPFGFLKPMETSIIISVRFIDEM